MKISVPAGTSEIHINRVSIQVSFVLEDGSTIEKQVSSSLKGSKPATTTVNIRSMLIEDFFAPRLQCRDALVAADIQTVGDLMEFSTYQIYTMMPHTASSRKSIRHLQERLREFGLELIDDLDEKAPTDWTLRITNERGSSVAYLSYALYNKITHILKARTLSKLTKYSEQDLLKFKGIGSKSVVEIKELLANYGLELRTTT